MSADMPYEIVELNKEDNAKLLADFSGESTGWLQVGRMKHVQPWRFREIAAPIYNMKCRPDDVWICTFPRSGTTVTQDMIWLLCKDFDFETAKKIPLVERFPQIDISCSFDDRLVNAMIAEMQGADPRLEAMARTVGQCIVPKLEAATTQRLIKCHLPFSLIPQNILDVSKVVYLCRNPKDVAVSYFYYSRLVRNAGFSGDFAKYWDYFERGLVRFGPYWPHVAEAWARKDHPNMLFLFYEDVIKDIPTYIKKMSSFLGKSGTEEQLRLLAEHLHIDNFRKNSSVNLESLAPVLVKGEQGFIRKGQSGGYKSDFTPELEARADRWIAENIKNIPGFAFPKH